ncbi:Phosphatidate phosphatase APP1 [Tolypocladium paradoxum]|uniref:Phosphatidate phosphatase APP1 n=1 Tax=Tolypocladium paradoxum TaxID=94208 RepID=A0A2S4KXV9_9HYPO|nr:Phosphatidate phosphatase APP1 [Tolypocladium paradoxum]
MGGNGFNPSSFAGAMQLRTRKENKFDEVESSLPDPRVPRLEATHLLNLSGLLNRLGNLNPFGKGVTSEDLVWLLDNTAFKSSPRGASSPWQAEFVAAVFEREAKGRVADMVAGVARAMGLADDAEERKTVEERVMPFLWDIRPARTITAVQAQHGTQLRLGPTNLNGLSSNVLRVPSSSKGSLVKTSTRLGGGEGAIVDMQTYYAGPDGWGIISDVDDTIKVTMTSDPIGILRETFVNSPRPISGMPAFYAEMKSLLPQDTAWFYLSASPYNLYPFLKQFRKQHYPPGTLILRDSSWKTVAGLLSALTLNTEEYKVDRMRKINSWLPRRKMIVIGDSTQSDPEAYGEIYRTIPGWIKMILIRKATDVAESGIDEKNEPERFQRAFKDIPRDAWHVFEDPGECAQIIKDAMQRN